MIYVLDHGRIIARGTFAEIERGGFSFSLLRQSAAVAEDATAAAGTHATLFTFLEHITCVIDSIRIR